MDVVFRTEVTVAIAEDGVLGLGSPDGEEYFYPPPATAVWIALRASLGSVRDATGTLATAWETDGSVVRELIERHVRVWREAGLVRTPVACSRDAATGRPPRSGRLPRETTWRRR
ncbi:hypothetical protein [Streptomyces sp. NPDC018347]|uniref:hypothetical protein n=1 Tax=Streptomyces sp. NPDC018347 TaxID=3157193 RepID=UPI00340E53C2